MMTSDSGLPATPLKRWLGGLSLAQLDGVVVFEDC